MLFLIFYFFEQTRELEIMLLKSDILFRDMNAKKEKHSTLIKETRKKDIKYSYVYRLAFFIFIGFVILYFFNPYELFFSPEKENIMTTDGNLIYIETMKSTLLFFIMSFVAISSFFLCFFCLYNQRSFEKTKIQNHNEVKESEKEYFKFIKNNVEELFQEVLKEKECIESLDRLERTDRIKRYNQESLKIIILSYEEKQLAQMSSEDKLKKILIEERLAIKTISNM